MQQLPNANVPGVHTSRPASNQTIGTCVRADAGNRTTFSAVSDAFGCIMKVNVRFFARAKDIVGAETVTVELEPNATIADLRSVLAEKYDSMKPMAHSLLFAIGTDYVQNDAVVQPDDEVVCFPPVSGG